MIEMLKWIVIILMTSKIIESVKEGKRSRERRDINYKYPSNKEEAPNQESDTDYIQDNIENQYPYKKKKYLLSIAEKNFYDSLRKVLEGSTPSITICPKVRLADIVYVSGTNKFQTYFNRIQSKHIDFIICTEEDMKPIFAIELDDKSHLRADRVSRDDFVNKLLKEVNMKLIRIPVRSNYDINELRQKIIENM